MSKPLVLTIHPPVPPNPRPPEPLTRMNTKFRSCMEWDDARARERRLTWQKRLTDAELAAEYWMWQGNQEWWLGRHRDPDRMPSRTVARVMERAATMKRFATLPHYDEAPSGPTNNTTGTL